MNPWSTCKLKNYILFNEEQLQSNFGEYYSMECLRFHVDHGFIDIILIKMWSQCIFHGICYRDLECNFCATKHIRIELR